jgi:hypothetical protein
VDWTLFCDSWSRMFLCIVGVVCLCNRGIIGDNWSWMFLCIVYIVCLCNRGIIVPRRKKLRVVFCIHLNFLYISPSKPKD